MRLSSTYAENSPKSKGGGLRFSLLLCFLVFAFSFAALAQQATIVGTVTDPSGSVVPHATVTATNTDTNVSTATTSNDVGQYVFPSLNIGHYTVKAEAAGFKLSQQTGIVLQVAARTRVDFQLQVGATQQSVTVEANAIRVQSDTGEQSSVVTGQQISQLAVNGRSIMSLYDLTPGASSLQGDSMVPAPVSGDVNVSFNGQRPAANLNILDGSENLDRGGSGPSVMPSMESIAEFRVMTSNYSAEYGLTSGATLDTVIKSGTKQLHAEAWEFNRNNWGAARNYFNPAPNPVSELRFNTFGFNVGGKIPGANNHPTFFFYNMEWRRLINGVNYNRTVPYAQTYGGNFTGFLPADSKDPLSGNVVPNSGLHVPCQDQLSAAQVARFQAAGITTFSTPSYTDATKTTEIGCSIPSKTQMQNGAVLPVFQALPGSAIPAALLDSNAQALLAAGIFPAPTNGQQFQGTPGTPTNIGEQIVRIDHTFSQKFSVFGHWVSEQVSQGYGTTQWSGDNVPTVGNTFNNPAYAAVVHATYMISPTLLNETAFNYNGNRIHITPNGLVSAPSGFTFNRVFTGPNVDNRIPTINLQGSTGAQYSSNWTPWNNKADDYDLRDDLSWTKGAHQFKFGAGWALYKKIQDLFNPTQGNFGFNGLYTGNDFADFLLGYAQNYGEGALQDSGHWNNISWDAYVQDNWRVNSRLTLNLGLRWDGIPHTYEANNRYSNFYPNLYNPANAPIFNADGTISASSPGLGTSPNPILQGYQFYLNGIGIPGQPGIPKGLVNNHWLNFGPRLGFAYDLTGTGKTILRGGFGQMYERIQGNDMYDGGPNQPFSFAYNTNNVLLANPKTSVGGTGATLTFPPAPILVGSLTSLDQYNYQNPTVYQYSLGVQRQLGGNAVLSLGYVGSQSRFQSLRQQIDLVPQVDLPSLVSGTNPTSYNQLVNYLGYHSIDESRNLGTGHYNSFQAEIRGNVTHDLTLQFGYTLSKSIDPAFSSGDGFDLQNVSNPYAGVQYDMGPSAFDRRNVAFANFVYNIPLFEHSSTALKSIAGGWQVSGIVTLESGPPMNLTVGGQTVCSVVPNCTERPDLTGSITYPKTVNAWFNPSAFAAPAAGTWGDLGKDALRGPGRDNWNMSLFKNFVLSQERGSRIELRFETFNTFNHTQWKSGDNVGGGISTDQASSNFGQVTGAFDARVIQLGARLFF